MSCTKSTPIYVVCETMYGHKNKNTQSQHNMCFVVHGVSTCSSFFWMT